MTRAVLTAILLCSFPARAAADPLLGAYLRCAHALSHNRVLNQPLVRALTPQHLVRFTTINAKEGFLILSAARGGESHFAPLPHGKAVEGRTYLTLLRADRPRYSHFEISLARRRYWPLFDAPAIDHRPQQYNTSSVRLTRAQASPALRDLRGVIETELRALPQRLAHSRLLRRRNAGDEHVGRGAAMLEREVSAALDACERSGATALQQLSRLQRGRIAALPRD